MTQYEFIRELEMALRGNVSDRVIRDNVDYYNVYIREQIASGKTEEEILAALGSPRLIAKTIIDTEEAADNSADAAEEHVNSWNFVWVKDKIWSSWIGKAAVILVVLFVIFLILSLFFKIVGILFKPAIVILAIIAVYYIIKNQTHK